MKKYVNIIIIIIWFCFIEILEFVVEETSRGSMDRGKSWNYMSSSFYFLFTLKYKAFIYLWKLKKAKVKHSGIFFISFGYLIPFYVNDHPHFMYSGVALEKLKIEKMSFVKAWEE